MATIDSYRFGHISVDGKEYTSDLIIFPDHVKDHWWRQSGHSLVPDDIAEIVLCSPDVLIIGCGESGVLRVPDKTKEYVQKQGIQLIAEDTQKACDLYNSLCQEKNVIAGLHLTC
jgi:hypothetical protein